MRNDDMRAAPAGLGWHPFFPRPPDTELEFRAQGVWHTDRALLPLQQSVVPPEWDFAVRRALGDVAIDNCFTRWQPPARVHWPSRGVAAQIDASIECNDLVVYVPPGRDFLAIEPVTHMTDGFNRASRGMAGTGTRTLAPGESFSCTMRLSLHHLN
jgi:aldose 1-epimerase